MILSDAGIQQAISSGRIIIDPPPEEDQYAPSALDLRVGHQFFEWNEELTKSEGISVNIDFDIYDHRKLRHFMKEIEKNNDETVTLEARKLYLAQTLEKIDLPIHSGLAARVEGRSSLARLGVSIHQTAPVIHCGFEGTLTLEIFSLGPFPIIVRPGKYRLCQLVFETLQTPPERGISSQFQGQDSPAGSK